MVKKYLRGINVSFLLLIIISTFSSCANEMNILEGNNNEQINFSVSVPEWQNTDSLSSSKTSRATPITDASLSTSNTFNLIADQNDGAGNYSTLINNAAVSSTNNIWQTTPSHYYWSGITNKTINFYAYYPTSISGNISHTVGSAPTLSYIVPNDAVNQIDIMTATANNISGNTNSSTPLIFNHIFAAVKFAVGINGLPSGTIKSITITGIKNTGIYTFGSGWSPSSATSSFTVLPSTTITGSAGANITSDVYTLMMIPQAFNNATVSLVYNNGTTFSTTISGAWTANDIYTYNLSKTIVFNYDYTGTVQTFTAPYTGTYRLEVWGAQSGGWGSHTNAPGGYAGGYKRLTQGDILYIVVGGKGYDVNYYADGTSYNGGGIGSIPEGKYGGGGATHIATHAGLLKDLSAYKSTVLVVGGGAGSNGSWADQDISKYLSGGGEVGLGSNTIYYLNANTTSTTKGNTGGTQTGVGPDGIKGGFGYGGNAADYGGAGGGGWYGGNAAGDGGVVIGTNGGGGSGYIGGVNNGAFQTGVRYGNGYARISFVSAN
ncbi:MULTISPECIES: fimbrillin family protein [Prevotella]|uniref:receptor protein-tyrosine kinase n=1 Tax=Prevotella herbatica TaxID=2801997 RepID=A0ABN6ELN1_9BACT|nr:MULTISPECIES: fimbrillin family protein [Prevotella]MDN5554207.1 fimbrillin family protein [Prevotella sp.]BCS85850.1 fimbrillin family protein [Prevotella herbatica]